ncbi:MAG: CRISPR-associated endonuclease Cas9 REC1/REC2 domain-containing protein [Christensenellales bacterium]
MALDDDEADFLETLKKVQSDASLHNILHGKEFISEAKTEAYETHRRDLSELKKYVRENCPEKYALVFRRQVKKGKKNTSGADENEKDDKKVNNYASYIAWTREKGLQNAKKKSFTLFLKKRSALKTKVYWQR